MVKKNTTPEKATHGVIVEKVAPVMHLLGHSLASAMGFAGVAAIALIPIGVIKLLIMAGMTGLAEHMDGLESVLIGGDVILFGIVFLSGVAVFAVETVADAVRKIRNAWKDK